MASSKLRVSDVLDVVFPRLEGESVGRKQDRAERDARDSEEIKKLVDSLPSVEDELKDYLTSIDKMVDKEQLRRSSVDSRLTSVIGLTSIAATVVLTALFSMAAGTLPLPAGPERSFLVLGTFYLALQLFAALNATVNGLSRAGYMTETAKELLPDTKGAKCVFLRRSITVKLALLAQHQEVNNEKVGRMAVAHKAVQNFLAALLILALVASYMAISRPNTVPISSQTAGAPQQLQRQGEEVQAKAPPILDEQKKEAPPPMAAVPSQSTNKASRSPTRPVPEKK